ncbi:MAG: 4Fe-4S binding protein [Christensenellales bacterium]|nr:4Fe-4S binding protein [Clostridiales bacterium]
MKRKIIKIDEDKCNGCGLCVNACAEGALQIVDGKAKLISESYCDGLGACLPQCPQDAISIEEREALPFDEEAVKKHTQANSAPAQPQPMGCPGRRSQLLNRQPQAAPVSVDDMPSMLAQWPCQIKLVPVNAPYFNGAHLLVAADCTAYAYANMHRRFMRNKITLIGCPKLDNADYSEKLTQILTHNDIKSVTVARMEAPCCAGIVNAVKNALIASGKMIPWRIITISVDGQIIEE